MLPLGAKLEPRPENQTVELDCGLVFWRLEDIVAYLRSPWLLEVECVLQTLEGTEYGQTVFGD